MLFPLARTAHLSQIHAVGPAPDSTLDGGESLGMSFWKNKTCRASLFNAHQVCVCVFGSCDLQPDIICTPLICLHILE